MKYVQLVSLALCGSVLVGCEKISSLTTTSVKCNEETPKALVIELLNKSINEQSVQRVKALIDSENITLDMGKLRGAGQQISFELSDVRTDNSDPNSKKEYCIVELKTNIPTQMIEDANAARAVYEEYSIEQSAIMSDIQLENGKIQHQLEYTVQPTDDGKKVYVNVTNHEILTLFLNDIIVDSLLKTVRQNAAEIQRQQEEEELQNAEREAQEAAEQAALDAENYYQVLLQEAQYKLDLSNKNLNLVWNATTKEVRDYLLDAQKLWLKKRDLECKLAATQHESPDIHRLECEAKMTIERTNILKNQIYDLE